MSSLSKTSGIDLNSAIDDDCGLIPLWRRIENSIREWISTGKYPPGAKLPPDRQIAEAFGVNRTTVQRSMSSLEQQGMIRIEHGVGRFVTQRIRYDVGERARFHQNPQAAPVRKLLRATLVRATTNVAASLEIDEGAATIRFDLVGYGGGVPISITSKYCSHHRFPGLADIFKAERSFTASFRHFGVEGLHRKSIFIEGRLPTTREARILEQPRTSVVFGFESLDSDLDGRPISFQKGCMPVERVTLIVNQANAMSP